MNYDVTHRTTYSGSEAIAIGQNQAWLTPRDLPRQRRLSFELHINPETSSLGERLDYFGNTVTTFTFNGGYVTLDVVAQGVVEVLPPEHPAPDQTPAWEEVAGRLQRPKSPIETEASQFRFDSPRSAAAAPFAEYARSSFQRGRPILDAVVALTERIHRDFEYRSQSTTVSTPVDEVFEKRRGVCQDFAHLEIAMLRSLGLAARYVSGYLRTIPPPGKERAIGADATHAWLSVYCGEAGWIDLDPTNNQITGDGHIVLAWGRDYGDVPPLRGVYIGGGAHKLNVGVDVVPLESEPAPR
ncbi:MAG: transglutaminase family protein [Planctomycetaceae bacterium]|nr:transglutaminase family protein [Planctomycetaceae bacterium]